MGMVGKFRAPTALSSVKRPGTHFVGWVGPNHSGRVRKISPLPGSIPRAVQAVASRYTDCTASADI